MMIGKYSGNAIDYCHTSGGGRLQKATAAVKRKEPDVAAATTSTGLQQWVTQCST
jgi:hypothetical protein